MEVRRLTRKRVVLGFEELEQRVVPTGPSNLSIPLDPNYDQFGDQIVTVQAYGDYTRTVFSHFDTGAATVSFSFEDQDKFSNPIPTKTPHGGAVARGIGRTVSGDVSNAGKILSDGMHAVSILYGSWG
jgi:hypothetical protein